MNAKPTNQIDRLRNISQSEEMVSGEFAVEEVATAEEPARDEAPSGAGSIFKALKILEKIVDSSGPVSVAQLATILNFSKPTTHRIAKFLEEFGLLEREPGGRRLVESQRFIDMSLKVVMSAAQRPNRHGILDWVVEQTGETCNLGIMDRGELVYLDRVEAEWPLGLRFEPGSRVPLHCTAIGKLFLSSLGDEALEKLLKTTRLTRYTDTTITDPEELRAALKKVGEAGISIDNQEFMYGVVCVAVPVFDSSGELHAGLAISAPEARMSVERVLEQVPILRAAADKMQAAMFTLNKQKDQG